MTILFYYAVPTPNIRCRYLSDIQHKYSKNLPIFTTFRSDTETQYQAMVPDWSIRYCRIQLNHCVVHRILRWYRLKLTEFHLFLFWICSFTQEYCFVISRQHTPGTFLSSSWGSWAWWPVWRHCSYPKPLSSLYHKPSKMESFSEGTLNYWVALTETVRWKIVRKKMIL